ncbi:helix-turn-helix transcriptional regulator [Dysgonomonas sp. GY617]|uniref:helix-turn-helix transcriptional regulator n=1 Tax=Dysgonomonas sp. GY617 TaxID=2780420 RepID=UPI001883388A|nr:LuxR C-terminal-related transcriptional regulator [Dysgonomonas sp. GY617]MBF0577706.1 hypothetical protein [Dysgonomonas sp. GY617]
MDKTIIPLTLTENKFYNLNGLGFQIKEIAEKMGIAYETAKSHMKNIKIKLDLQKDKEVTAHFWCNLVGADMDEVKKRVMASCLLLIFLLYIPFDHLQMRENRNAETRAGRTIVARRNDYTA